MNISIFSRCEGKLYNSISAQIPEEWTEVHSDKYFHVFKNKEVDAKAVLVLDDDGYIRNYDVKKRSSDGSYNSIWLYTGIFSDARSLNDIRCIYNVIKKLETHKPIPVCTRYDFKSATRNAYKRIYKYGHKDRLSVPLSNTSKEWRTVDDGTGDTCTDFIIIPDTWADLWGTDEEQTIYDDIEQFVYNTVGYNTAYDFPTGRMITLSWGFKRVPCGVAIVHSRGIDW